MRKKQIHRHSVDPGKKKADIFAGERAYRTVYIEILVTRTNDSHWPHTLASPSPPGHRLKTKAPFIKEKDLGLRSFLKQHGEFF